MTLFPYAARPMSLLCCTCVLTLAAWGQEEPDLSQLPPPKDTVFGINYVPAHLPDVRPEDPPNALLEAMAVGSHVSYIWEWSSGQKGYDDAVTLTRAARALKLKLFLQLAPMGIGAASVPPDLTDTSFSNPDVRERYLADVKRLAELKPDFLVLAAEVNLLYEVNPEEFRHYVSLHAEAYKMAKRVSPESKISVSYHMDMLFAFNQLELLEILEGQDFIGLTSYPSWLITEGVYKKVSDIPLWYYRRLRLMIARPIVFSELAWPTGGKNSLEEQEQFVARLPELMRGVDPLLITWAMQHDVHHFQVAGLNDAQIKILLGFKVDAAELFEELNTMGLLSWDGPPKPAWFRALEYPTASKSK